MLEVIFLSVVQGITEFLPVSSSAHLILISNYFNFENQNLTIDMSLHAGSLFAILYYFKSELLNFKKNKNLYTKILIASVPTLIVGYFLVKLNIIEQLRNYKVIGFTTIIFGILLYFADKAPISKKITNTFNFRSTIVIGLYQVLSLVPGVSRSGITISAARILNYNREDSAKISFLLSIPILVVITIFNIFSLYEMNNFSFSILNIISIFFSFILSLTTIKYFLSYVKKFSLNVFVIYRIILGAIILLLIK